MLEQRVTQRTQALLTANAHLETLSATDSLTGAFNRRHLFELLDSERERVLRGGEVFSLLLIDLDFFKRVNDGFGHAGGDAVVCEFVMRSREVVRKTDVICRYGGEEFALVLSDTPRTGALTFARAIMNLLKARGLVHPQSEASPLVTISGGITTCVPDDTTTAEVLLQRADEALYTAKGRGRNRFFSYEMKIVFSI